MSINQPIFYKQLLPPPHSPDSRLCHPPSCHRTFCCSNDLDKGYTFPIFKPLPSAFLDSLGLIALTSVLVHLYWTSETFIFKEALEVSSKYYLKNKLIQDKLVFIYCTKELAWHNGSILDYVMCSLLSHSFIILLFTFPAHLFTHSHPPHLSALRVIECEGADSWPKRTACRLDPGGINHPSRDRCKGAEYRTSCMDLAGGWLMVGITSLCTCIGMH